jgi:hypothetical protein
MGIKSYTNVWNFEKHFHAIGDLKLPFAFSMSQITWFTISVLLIIIFDKIPPLSLIGNDLVKYLLLPALLTWLMNKKTFDGKKPISFIKTFILYILRAKVTYAGMAVKLNKKKVQVSLTTVRGCLYVSD